MSCVFNFFVFNSVTCHLIYNYMRMYYKYTSIIPLKLLDISIIYTCVNILLYLYLNIICCYSVSYLHNAFKNIEIKKCLYLYLYLFKRLKIEL